MITQIKNRYTKSVIFECDVPDTVESGMALRHALEKAVAVKQDLRGAYLRGACLRGACLHGADLRGADLRGADLGGADLRDADLRDTDLRDTDLRDAYLRGADLGGADLRDAYLVGSDLRDAYLRDTDLGGADLGGKKLVGDRPFIEVGPIGSRNDFLQAWITDTGPMICAGCFFDTRSQFELQLAENHGNNEHGQEYTAALVLIDKHIELWTPKVEVAA